MSAALMLPKPTPKPKAPRRPIPRTKPLARGTSRIRRRVTIASKRAAVKAAGYVDPDTWQAVVEFHGGLCAYCELRPWCHRDHVEPVSKGGLEVISNLVPACPECNYRKGTLRWEPIRRHPWMEAR